jgi:hypothetical protein
MIDFGILRQKDNNKIKAQMIREAACCFILCAVARYKNNSENTEIKKELKKIALNSSLGDSCKATGQDKNYFRNHISAFVDNDPLFITLANNIFNDDGCLLDIKKIISEFKKNKTQPFTDIRKIQ